MLNNVYPVSGAGIQTHDLWNITTRPGRCYISYLKNELGNEINKFFNGLFSVSFSFIFVFSIQLKIGKQMFDFKICQWLDLNRGSLVSATTTAQLDLIPEPTKNAILQTKIFSETIHSTLVCLERRNVQGRTVRQSNHSCCLGRYLMLGYLWLLRAFGTNDW